MPLLVAVPSACDLESCAGPALFLGVTHGEHCLSLRAASIGAFWATSLRHSPLAVIEGSPSSDAELTRHRDSCPASAHLLEFVPPLCSAHHDRGRLQTAWIQSSWLAATFRHAPFWWSRESLSGQRQRRACERHRALLGPGPILPHVPHFQRMPSRHN